VKYISFMLIVLCAVPAVAQRGDGDQTASAMGEHEDRLAALESMVLDVKGAQDEAGFIRMASGIAITVGGLIIASELDSDKTETESNIKLGTYLIVAGGITLTLDGIVAMAR